ncbi:hypothetical protein CC85DRAFT_284331 [Cutaneotrichosporon oleaginosum]|uniref:Uncharacterized protein n=1 Tax=Cutaneotrichosporon oleaginosum TaxID=879819 RepID=A0A0J1B7C4_9TREE|nr:uncharacterized protein CC85DRAFT_284331 [Cutaneotrichosporon oleaginosum]KLT43624.1 hypothetical protein CC85DRAFT_284331 [Cutaneotrichosporon oleaginosum]TXT12708.1 hypothetical protein COLE_03118 [Cutaneotrichosporon oleaginosum]
MLALKVSYAELMETEICASASTSLAGRDLTFDVPCGADPNVPLFLEEGQAGFLNAIEQRAASSRSAAEFQPLFTPSQWPLSPAVSPPLSLPHLPPPFPPMTPTSPMPDVAFASCPRAQIALDSMGPPAIRIPALPPMPSPAPPGCATPDPSTTDRSAAAAFTLDETTSRQKIRPATQHEQAYSGLALVAKDKSTPSALGYVKSGAKPLSDKSAKNGEEGAHGSIKSEGCFLPPDKPKVTKATLSRRSSAKLLRPSTGSPLSATLLTSEPARRSLRLNPPRI